MTARGATEAYGWHAGDISLSGTFATDVDLLDSYVRAASEVLKSLPEKPGRDDEQQQLAARVLQSVRCARDAFARGHADAVYDELTSRRTRRPRLDELLVEASRRFPGLVPTQAQMATERRMRQADKDGLEIDQGILIHHVLRSAAAGGHLVETMQFACRRALTLLPEFCSAGVVRLDTVEVRRERGAAWLTFHNGHCLNAEDDQHIEDMETAVDLALLDDDVKVGVLRGGVVRTSRYAGRRVFSAGINLRELSAGRISYVDFLLRRELTYIRKIHRGLRVVPPNGSFGDPVLHKPWIAAVDEFAIGGGMQLLAVVDHVIAADNAYFSLPAAQEGIVPGLANLRLARFVGNRLARQMILFGRRIDASGDEARLVCDRVVPATEIDAAVDEAVEQLTAPAVAMNRAMLHLAEEPADAFREYLAEFALAQAQRLHSADVVEKVDRWSHRSDAGKART